MPSAPRRRAAALSALAAAAALCACGSLLAAGALPGLAAARLGPPAEDLDPLQRATLAAYLLIRSADLDRPAGEDSAVVSLEVPVGQTASQVIDRLGREGLVSDPFLLQSFMRYRGLDRGIDAGRYELRGSMSPRQIAEGLQSAGAAEVPFTVIEGWRREEIASALPADRLTFTSQDFLGATAAVPAEFAEAWGIPTGATLEGFLFPDTYHLTQESTAGQLVQAMLVNLGRRVDGGLRADLGAQGLSLYQAITLASIVEREAAVPEERPLIASVFLNRLRAGMKLEADPTVQYALGQGSDGKWWKSPLSAADLAIGSPYNTYQWPGLPPGPIANPGLSSIRSVAHPAESAYFYFRAACDGSGRHLFARTFEEHLANACR